MMGNQACGENWTWWMFLSITVQFVTVASLIMIKLIAGFVDSLKYNTRSSVGGMKKTHPAARTELYINQSFNTHKHTLLLLSWARDVRKLKNNNCRTGKISKAFWTIHVLTEWQSFITHKLLFSLANTHSASNQSPPSILFSQTHTNHNRQSHYIKQKPVTAHISGCLESVWTHSWERLGFHMRPVSLCFVPEAGLRAAPLLWL